MKTRRKNTYWAIASFDEVRNNMLMTGYAEELLHFVVGDVLTTLPTLAPEKIALLRLDTDWYESTAHELRNLWPRLQPGGILIIDDYGWWKGARRAVDEWMKDLPQRLFLHRIDHSSRLIIKQ